MRSRADTVSDRCEGEAFEETLPVDDPDERTGPGSDEATVRTVRIESSDDPIGWDDPLTSGNTRTLADPTPSPKPLHRIDPNRSTIGSGAPAEDGEERTGRTLGGFELRRVVGRGGMGIVYEAHQASLGRTVAVKVLTAGIDASPIEIERFLREASAAARLRHPSIVRIYEVGEEDGTLFFAMDLIVGQPLSALIASDALSARRALELTERLARALDYAHRQGVIHRDVKPGNILVDADGLPHLTDFGLAKDLQKDAMTVSNAVMGTPSYMPPEQARGRTSEVDARSDVYSLGAVLYELLTGRPPFRGDSLLDTLAKVVEAEPPRPKRLVTELHRDIETIVLRCLAKDPARRYQSALELADDIRRYLDGETIHARPAGPIERVVRQARKHRVKVLAVAIAIVAASAALGVVAWQRGEAERDRLGRGAQALAEARALRASAERRGDFEGEARLLEDALGRVERAAAMGHPDARLELELTRRRLDLVKREAARAGERREDERRREAALHAAREERLRTLEGSARANLDRGREHLEAAQRVGAASDGAREALASYRLAISALLGAADLARALAEAGAGVEPVGAVAAALQEEARDLLATALAARAALGLETDQPALAEDAAADLERQGLPAGEVRRAIERYHDQQGLVDGAERALRRYLDDEAGFEDVTDALAAADRDARTERQRRALELMTRQARGERARRLAREARAETDPARRIPLLEEALALRDAADLRYALATARAEVECPDGFVLVSGGAFTLGSEDPEDRSPLRRDVPIAPFYISLHEVTRGELTGLAPEAGGLLPATGVTFDEALAYARSRGLRLPTADEWEVAAGFDPGTGTRRTYPWGGSFSRASGVFKYEVGRAPKELQPEPVGTHPRDVSALGIHDMGGNAQEWTTARGDDGALVPVLKGGGYDLPAERFARTAWRKRMPRDYTGPAVGLRLARDVSPALLELLAEERAR